MILKGVWILLGMAGFYGRFIKYFSSIAKPLHVLKHKNARFVWDEAQQVAFERLKKALSMPPVLQISDFSRMCTLVCDANDLTISAVLNQRQGKELAPVTYSSHLLSPTERRYSIHEKECLAVVYSCEKYQSYLEHKGVLPPYRQPSPCLVATACQGVRSYRAVGPASRPIQIQSLPCKWEN
jgi:hypothetical protein